MLQLDTTGTHLHDSRPLESAGDPVGPADPYRVSLARLACRASRGQSLVAKGDVTTLATAARLALQRGHLDMARVLHKEWLWLAARGCPGKVEALAGLALVHERLGATDVAAHLAHRADALSGGASAETGALVVGLLGRLAARSGDLEAAGRYLARLKRLDPIAARDDRISAELDWGCIGGLPGHREDHPDEPVASPQGISVALARLLTVTGRLDEARAAALTLVRASGKIRDERSAWAHLLLARLALEDEDERSSRHLARRAAVIAAACSSVTVLTEARLLQGQIALVLERPRRALRAAAAALALARRHRHRAHQLQARVLATEALLASGNPSAAQIQADGALLLVPAAVDTSIRLHLLVLVASAALASGRSQVYDAMHHEIADSIGRLDESGTVPSKLVIAWAGSEARRGRPELAARVLRRLQDDRAGLSGVPASSLLELAVGANAVDAALQLVSRLSARFRKGPRGRLLEATVLHKAGRHERALALLRGLSPSPDLEVPYLRLREMIARSTGPRSQAEEWRSRWLRAAAEDPAAALASLRHHRLLGRADCSLVSGADQRLISSEEARLGAPESGLDVMVDLLNQEVRLGDGRRLSFGDHPMLFAALVALAREKGRPIPRRQLYQRLWETRYDPEVHEQKVLKTLQRLRDRLGPWADGRPLVHLDVMNGNRLRPDLKVGILQTLRESRCDKLSARQRRILQALEGGHPTPVADLEESCRASHTSVVVDLAGLIRLGLVTRQGRARASRYVLAAWEPVSRSA
ncbi:MAG: hypothetical protein HY815_15225 [Candidatus Riflebacteria bacterium]|nr:hypothetical protein [Candidatus Riflebacteria bacterium]